MIECKIRLISEEISQDEYGQEIETEYPVEVYAIIQSASSAEFFRGYQAGVKPSLAFLVLAAEYSGQRIVEHDGRRYAIYRTYRRDIDHIELHCEEQEGVKGG